MEKIERLRNLDIGVNFDDVIAPWLNLIKEIFSRPSRSILQISIFLKVGWRTMFHNTSN